jgi:RNA polymerase nonessential primary-like sigma factor
MWMACWIEFHDNMCTRCKVENMAFTGIQSATLKTTGKPLTVDRSSVRVLRKQHLERNSPSCAPKTRKVSVRTPGLSFKSPLYVTSSLVSTKNREESKKLKLERDFSLGSRTQSKKRETSKESEQVPYQNNSASKESTTLNWQKKEEPLSELDKQTKQTRTDVDSKKTRKLRASASKSKKSPHQSKRLKLKKKVQKEEVTAENQAIDTLQEENSSENSSSENSPSSSGYSNLPFSQAYVQAIDKNPLLTQKEEVELANYLKKQSQLMAIQQRMMQKLGRKLSLEEWAVRAEVSVRELHDAIILGNNAKERLITANLRLVHSIASRFAYESSHSFHQPVQLVDLIQEGILGLIQATEKFDASYGWRFSTFATWWIRASISKYLNEHIRSVRVPSKVLALYNQSKKVATELENNKKVVNESEVCSLLGVSSSRLRCCIEAVTNQPVSLERLGELLESKGLLDQGAVYCIADTRECTEENLAECLLRADVSKILREYVSPMEARALMLRYGLRDGRCRSLEECGKIMSCSRERVRQLLLNGITKLRNSTVENFLKDYLQ